MTAVSLTASVRSDSAANLRRRGMVPAVAYGHGFETVHVEVREAELIRAFREVGHSAVISLVIDGKKKGALIHVVDRHPFKPRIDHADFRLVKMDEVIHAEIAIHPEGESPAVKLHGGVLVQNLEALEVAGKPGDLVSEIRFDISGLTELGVAVHAGDIKLPAGLHLVTEADASVFAIMAPRTAAQEEAENVTAEAAAEATPAEGEKKSE